MGMYMCLLFCLLSVDTVIGIKFGDQGVCMVSQAKLSWVVFFF